MFIYSLFALYYIIRHRTYSHFHMSPFTGRASEWRLNTYSSCSTENSAFHNIFGKNRYKKEKEEGCDLHLEETPVEPKEQELFVVPNIKEQKRRKDDAEILNGIHHRMFSTVFIENFKKTQQKVKLLYQPQIIDAFYNEIKFKQTEWIKPFNIGSGELWEKFQKENEVW